MVEGNNTKWKSSFLSESTSVHSFKQLF